MATNLGGRPNGSDFLRDVQREVSRARRKFPGQEHSIDMGGWTAILGEEFGEVAREVCEYQLGNRTGGQFVARIRGELVQVAAMAELMASAMQTQLEDGAIR